MGEVIDKIENIGIVFCSVDAPQLPRTRIVTNNAIYLRIHGYNTRMPHMNGYEFVAASKNEKTRCESIPNECI